MPAQGVRMGSVTEFMVKVVCVCILCGGLLNGSTTRGDEQAHPEKAIVIHGDGPRPETPRPVQTLDRIAAFFRLTIVDVALVTIGLIGLIFEFKYPGTTFPGGVAAICFVLFFWAH